MKIRITEPGWAGFTGLLGTVDFEDGVSVDEVSGADARELAGIIGVENADNGRNPSAAQLIVDSQMVEAPVEVKAEVVEGAAAAAAYDKAALEKVADAQGIKGIREIAEPMGLKGASITELIEKVLTAQAAAAAAEAK